MRRTSDTITDIFEDANGTDIDLSFGQNAILHIKKTSGLTAESLSRFKGVFLNLIVKDDETPESANIGDQITIPANLLSLEYTK